LEHKEEKVFSIDTPLMPKKVCKFEFLPRTCNPVFIVALVTEDIDDDSTLLAEATSDLMCLLVNQLADILPLFFLMTQETEEQI
jgi:hypothetical protein